MLSGSIPIEAHVLLDSSSFLLSVYPGMPACSDHHFFIVVAFHSTRPIASTLLQITQTFFLIILFPIIVCLNTHSHLLPAAYCLHQRIILDYVDYVVAFSEHLWA